jgi:hypothetical protein
MLNKKNHLACQQQSETLSWSVQGIKHKIKTERTNNRLGTKHTAAKMNKAKAK